MLVHTVAFSKTIIPIQNVCLPLSLSLFLSLPPSLSLSLHEIEMTNLKYAA